MVLGTTVGGYRLIDVLGAGGMGEVFRAEDVRLGREVALKVLHDSLASDTDWFARFEREARVLASLNHPNIATLLGFRDLDDRCVIEMELVPGDTLAKRIATGAVPLNELLPIVKQIAQALEAAHDRGVIHRDLKPANIKITPDGRVKVLDFGIAKVLAEGPVLDVANTPTSSGTRRELLLGTPRYMSPEQVRALPLDRRTDIWSFGCVFYEALTARPAFAADSGTDTMAAILRDEPDWTALDHVPAIIQRLIRRCLRKDQQVPPARHRGRPHRDRRGPERDRGARIRPRRPRRVPIARPPDGRGRRCGRRPGCPSAGGWMGRPATQTGSAAARARRDRARPWTAPRCRDLDALRALAGWRAAGVRGRAIRRAAPGVPARAR